MLIVFLIMCIVVVGIDVVFFVILRVLLVILLLGVSFLMRFYLSVIGVGIFL